MYVKPFYQINIQNTEKYMTRKFFDLENCK